MAPAYMSAGRVASSSIILIPASAQQLGPWSIDIRDGLKKPFRSPLVVRSF